MPDPVSPIGAPFDAPLPTLRTRRLLLRAFAERDAPDVERHCGEQYIAANTLTIPHPYPAGAALSWIASHADRWRGGIGAAFAIEERGSGALVGAAGLQLELAHRRGELGYWVGAPHRGRGYATEAVCALLDFGFDHLGLERVHAAHFARNPASGVVMQRAGMRHEGTLRRHYLKWGVFEDAEVYAALRDDPRPLAPED